jgi:hypothetical protein
LNRDPIPAKKTFLTVPQFFSRSRFSSVQPAPILKSGRCRGRYWAEVPLKNQG